jgi:hypothetical protein
VTTKARRRSLNRVVNFRSTGSLLPAGETASAQPTQRTLDNHERSVFEDTHAVRPGLTATVTDSLTDSGHFVITDNTVHFSGVTTHDHPVDPSDRTHLTKLVAEPLRGRQQRAAQPEFTEPQQDRGTPYAANVDVIGIVSGFDRGGSLRPGRLFPGS